MAAKPAKAAPAKKEAAPAAEGDAPKGNKKLILIFGGVILLLVLVIAGGAAWYFLKAKDTAAPQAEAKKVEVHKEPKFIPLEHFVGNLQPDGTGPVNFAIELSLEIFDPEMELKIKALMPEIRSKLNLLISSKTGAELGTVNGKKRLAQQIKKAVNGVLGIHAEGEGHDAEGGHASEGGHPAEGAPATDAPHEAAHDAPHEAGHELAAASGAASAVAEAPVVDEPVSPDAKGVAAVLFTSLIIAY